jgi:hypothetical protein
VARCERVRNKDRPQAQENNPTTVTAAQLRWAPNNQHMPTKCMHIIYIHHVVCATEHWRGEGGRPHSPRRSQLKNAPPTMLLFQKCSLPKLQATVWAVPKLSSETPLGSRYGHAFQHATVRTREACCWQITAGRSGGGLGHFGYKVVQVRQYHVHVCGMQWLWRNRSSNLAESVSE